MTDTQTARSAEATGAPIGLWPLALAFALLYTGCTQPQQSSPGAEQNASPTQTSVAPPEIAQAQINATPEDSAIFADRMALAQKEHMDTLPIGEIIARIGQTFVGDPYVPGTLEAEGPERLVVNLRTFDCVTFVENTLALSRTIKAGGDYQRYLSELAHIRYRGGRMDGYPSRLHYFSDWIADNDSKGVVRNLTRELGGVVDPEPITFMTSHISAYRQLSDVSLVDQIRKTEAKLTADGRVVIPEDAIAGVSDRIRNGDIIAAATNVAGLDIAHTGIALYVDGTLRLMHAPLVGSTVQISPNTIAERIKASGSQDGIMVARPQ